MKYALLFLFLLVTIASQGQMGRLNLSGLSDSAKKALIGYSQSFSFITGVNTYILPEDSAQCDTVKVIAEIYYLPRRYVFAGKSYWEAGGSTIVVTYKVLAWEVWTKRISGLFFTWDDNPGPGAPRLIKRLSYNKKDSLPNVLQSWRVEW